MSIGGMGFMSGTAQAKKSTLYKYGTIAGAAVTGYGLVKGKGKVATVGALATAGSYYMYKHSKKKEDQRHEDWYRKRYGSNWRHHYTPRHSKSAEQRREDWYRKRYGNDWKRHYNPHH
jgi:hypothetical protein